MRPALSLESSAKQGPPGSPGFGFTGLLATPLNRHYGADVSLSQTLFDFGRTAHRVAASRYDAAAAQHVAAASDAGVGLEARLAFYDALLSQRLERLAREVERQDEALVRAADARFQAGLTSRVDVDLARAALARARAARFSAEADTQAALQRLGTAMGLSAPPPAELEDSVAPPYVPPPGLTDEVTPASPSGAVGGPGGPAPIAGSPTAPGGTPLSGAARGGPPGVASQEELRTLAAAAVRRRPEVLAAQALTHAAEADVESARSARRPLVRAIASAGWVNPGSLIHDSNRYWSVGAAVSIPILSGGLLEAQEREARHHLDAVRSAEQAQDNAARLEAVRARLRLDALEQAVPAGEEQVRQSEDALRLARERYRTGLGSFLELQQAQLAYVQAETDDSRALYAREAGRAELDHALGRDVPCPTGAPSAANP